MDYDLAELYAKYKAYMDEMDADLNGLDIGIATGSEADRWRPRRLDYQEFQAMWSRIADDRGLRQTWVRRLTLGYAEVKQTVRQMLREHWSDVFAEAAASPQPDGESAAA